MKHIFSHRVLGHRVDLLPQKAAYLPGFGALLIADLHLGKINHFRKSGIAVPPLANDRNTELIIEMIQSVKPARVIFLGDLFHSHYNEEWQVLGQIIRHFSGSSFELVKGNHDILSNYRYARHHITVHDKLALDNFVLTHHPLEEVPPGRYNVAGHVHPGARLSGKGRQSLTLPCFCFGKDQALLPAFGSFTGLARIRVSKADRVFVVVNHEIIPIPHS